MKNMKENSSIKRQRVQRAGRKGMAVVEFAILAPVVLTMFLGIVETGWWMRNRAVISNASREGARYAAMGWAQDKVYDRVVEAASPLLVVDRIGDVQNGDIQMKFVAPSDTRTYPQFPDYIAFPTDSCLTKADPKVDPELKPQAAGARLVGTADDAPVANDSPFALLGDVPHAVLLDAPPETPPILLVKGRPPTAPTPTPYPTPTVKPTPTPAPTPTPVPAATPTPTPGVVPTAGPTPMPDLTPTGITCRNRVPPGSLIQITVNYDHKPLTRFFPFLNDKDIQVSTVMRRD